MRAVALLLTCAAIGCVSSAPERTPADLRSGILERELQLPSEDDFEQRTRLASECIGVVGHPETADRDRLSYAERALKHAERAATLRPERAEGHYYRAIALGYVLEHSTLPPLGRIQEMEASAVRARELDPALNDAGPLRFLAILYLRAPAWPVGPELAGEEDVIEELWEEALGLAPDHAENHAYYAEFLLEVGRNAEAREQVLTAQRLLHAEQDLHPWEREELERRLSELLEALSG